MDRKLIRGLANKYATEGLDLLQALKIWKENNLSPDNIKDQVQFDIGKKISAVDARNLYHIGSAMKYDYDTIAKDFEVSKGREDLIPENIKENKIKLSPAIRQSMERIGQNLFRDKKAKKYWTLKEKVGDDGQKAVYLVAIEDNSEKKVANE